MLYCISVTNDAHFDFDFDTCPPVITLTLSILCRQKSIRMSYSLKMNSYTAKNYYMYRCDKWYVLRLSVVIALAMRVICVISRGLQECHDTDKKKNYK